MVTPQEDELFRMALSRPVEKRRAFLEAVCDGDAELRQRLEARLARAERETSAAAAAGSGPGTPDPEDPDATRASSRWAGETPGRGEGVTVARYKILEKVGEGGCGAVYVAEQTEPVRRRVALKVIKLGMDTEAMVARFEAERQALAMMDHPNIAKVFDAGSTDQGRPYFVMELVRGVRITEYCDQNHLPTRERLELFIRVCHAIQHAHQKGIIHRDIKPSNILVTLHDGVPVPKVIDFGIAKAVEGRLTDATVYTQLHQFLGTPVYMSPEQAEMSGLDIDTRSDLYSLGVLLYELLTGRTPFDAGELAAQGLDAMRRTIREREPVRPSTRVAALAGEELSTTAKRRSAEVPRLIHLLRGDLDWIVMKCLEKDRTRRYDTAHGLAMDLNRHLHHEPVLARPPSARYRLQKLVRRNRLAVGAAAGVVLSLISGLGLSLWQYREARLAYGRAVDAEREQSRLREDAQVARARESELRAKADTEAERARKEAARSGQIAGFLERMLAGAAPAVARGRDSQMLREILAETSERLKTELKDQPEVEASLRATLSGVYYDLGEYETAVAMGRESIRLFEASVGADAPQVSVVRNNLAGCLHRMGRWDECEGLLRESLRIQRRLHSGDHRDVVISLVNIASMQMFRWRLTEAEAGLKEGLAMARRLYGDSHALVANIWNQLGVVLARQDNAAESETVFRKVLAMRRTLLGADHPEVAEALNNVALSLQSLGRFEEARAMLEESLALKRKLLGPDHPEYGGTLHNLAGVLRDLGKLDEAASAYEQALANRTRSLGASHADTKETLEDWTGVLLRQDKFAEAEALQRRAAPETNGASTESGSGASRLRGMLLARHGRDANAIAELRKALESAPNDAEVHAALGLLLAQAADWGDLGRLRVRTRGLAVEGRPPKRAEAVVLALLAGSSDAADLNAAERWVTAGAQGVEAGDPLEPAFTLLRALIDLRRDRADRAWAGVKEVAGQFGQNYPRAALAAWVAALARQQLGDAAGFREWTARAEAKMASNAPDPRSRDFGVDWATWAAVRAMAAEARGRAGTAR